MTTDHDAALRRHILAFLEGGQAFAPPATILADVPVELRGRRLEGFDHSLWELLEHLRIAQRDILDFSLEGQYHELDWPREYWPASASPPGEGAWDESLKGFLDGLEEAKRIAADEAIDLFSIVPHGSTQTYLRELLLIADHNAHHLGQIIALRKLLGAWPK